MAPPGRPCAGHRGSGPTIALGGFGAVQSENCNAGNGALLMSRPTRKHESTHPGQEARVCGGVKIKPASLVIYTIGHSTRDLPKFIEILQNHGVTQLVDVRTIPRSRKNPQYNAETLPDELRVKGIRYVHLPGLGGLRHAARDSANLGWHNASFRGFADYMQTPTFEKGIEDLIRLASSNPTAIMCAESLPWRCHRSMIADALTVRGVKVLHIFSAGRTQEHTLTPFARVEGLKITYPQAETANFASDEP